jgi:hypothetical protein
VPNGDNTGGPDLRGPRAVIWLMIFLMIGLLLVVLNEVSGRALWGY